MRPGLSPYNYVQNNPLNRIDPTGMLDEGRWHWDDELGMYVYDDVVVVASKPAVSLYPLWIGLGWKGAFAEPSFWGEIGMGLVTGGYLTYTFINKLNNEETNENDEVKEHTPATHPEEYENVRKSKAKKNKITGEIWVPDLSVHGGEHYEVYKNKNEFEKGNRDRDVWKDGRPKSYFKNNKRIK